MTQLTDADQKLISDFIDKRIAVHVGALTRAVSDLSAAIENLSGSVTGNAESIGELYSALSALRAELPIQVEAATLSITRAQVARIMREESAQ